MMLARRLFVSLLAVAVVATGLTACGGDSGTSTSDKNEYIKKVNEAQTEFANGAAKLNLANPSSPADFKNSLDQLDPLLSKIISDLDSIDPPSEVSAQHDKLVNSMRDYQKAVNGAKGGLASGDKAQAQQSAQKIATASSQFSQTFDATINEINTKLKQ